MTLVAEYRAARHSEDVARLRRVLALRAMVASGMSQRDIAAELGVSQPAVSQRLKAALILKDVHPEALLKAAAPLLRILAETRGFTELAVFGSVARHQARLDSDIDLLVRQPAGTSISGMRSLQDLFEAVLGRPVDLITYGGLKPGIDDDILREAVLL
ncbi:MAG: nucleotidyltransferase domain-containing protein [Propionicimonas sp.]|uniref:nucleotidyltransferase domain-containing protein n=1 Tax=Propionicimonas sp. TaxID=1955623 RepID=UPI002B1E9ECC|nr:nucleotidyltransferase domain-containing protein [Propionicimonas sp.]MEA4943928.1 nucleotidyltransferase domain-containing protein [Propionicimonas sp.]MEA5052002.1 nucleotidyltransferase domain-containing protein [Propionicimonas sp.]MEA5116203.1 nucleotidyltransferase domain-containing protein [Propionicimonas sp.]